MNRVIKFRAWDIKRKKMMYMDSYNSLSIYEDGYCLYYGAKHALTEETSKLMQFTGLRDKNGKEIYEGDILKIPESYIGDTCFKEHIGYVSFEEAEFLFSGGDLSWNKTEVIGNIYENPEMIDE